MFRKLMRHSYNLISLAGILLAIAGASLIVVFLAIGIISGIENPYLGILIYFVFPGILVLGLLLIPVGILHTRKKMLREGISEVPLYPTLDLNDPHQRHKAVFFIVATLFFLLILALASIKGYDYTESTEFCGELCHTVMEPEYTAWGNSPHARVKCADCHIGPGAKVVCQSQAVRSQTGIPGPDEHLPNPDRNPHSESAAGTRYLRGLPLACKVLFRQGERLFPLRIRRKEYAPGDKTPFEPGKGPQDPPCIRHPLACQLGSLLHSPRRETTGHPLY